MKTWCTAFNGRNRFQIAIVIANNQMDQDENSILFRTTGKFTNILFERCCH